MKAPNRGTGRSAAGTLRRVGVTVALLAVATIGAASRAGTHLSTTGIPNGAAAPLTAALGISVVVAACLTLAALAVLAWRRRGRPVLAGPAAARRPSPLLLAATLVTLAATGLLVIGLVRAGRRGRPALHSVAMPLSAGTALVVSAAALATAVALTAAMVHWRRRWVRNANHTAGPPVAPLAAAVTAGSTALGAVTDARQAIIACYVAMEEALAAAGSPRRAADTPEELLRRAQRDGVVATPAAARLTDLFREARFSTHLLGATERDAAALALADISSELGGVR